MLAVVVAAVRFHFALHIGWTILPTVLLVAFSGASIGYGFAMLLQPQVSQQLSNFISIGILLFSPINFPLGRLPVWVRDVHRVLPVMYMGNLMRWSLTGRYGASVALDFIVVGAWCAAGLAASYALAIRRR